MRDVRTIRVSENSYEAFYRKVRKNHPIKKEYSYIAVDGSHVNDLGMYRIANALIPLVQ